jgi:hypothetical protein
MRILRPRLNVSWLMVSVAVIAAPLGAWRELSRRPEAVVLGGTVHDLESVP